MPPPVTFTASSWIWTNEGTSLPGEARAFRYTFSPPAGELPVYATVLVTCDNSYTFWLNGNLIAVSPTTTDWTVAQRYVLQLIPGPNVFAFVGFNWDVDPSPAGLLVSAQVELASGALVNFVTDSTWRTLNAQAPPVDFYLSTFNDISWNSSTSYAIYGGGPWGLGPMPPPVTFGSSFWIWTSEGGSDQFPGEARAFRFTFHPPAGLVPLFATIVVTCDNGYTFFLNGEFVAISPSISESSEDWTVAQRYVLPLQSGANVFAFVGFNSDVGPTPAGLLVRGQVQLVSSSGGMGGSTLVNFGTDGTWRTLNGQSPPLNFELPSFDDSSWNSSTAYAAYGGGVWGSITIPPLT
ncbi:hypothetical protein FB451DRAFT_1043696 [Mycena latifolia]|nr:hypothetical protein FB451DRAFT_1043696 [Mycena latifolia]